MDISETYIKMCKQAEEIQGRYFSTGDYFSRGFGAEIHCDYEAFEGCIWLPRQDQLQEMVGFVSNEWWLLDLFIRFTRETDISKITSMEQLWLSFVMSIRYQKIWNGTGWISQPESP